MASPLEEKQPETHVEPPPNAPTLSDATLPCPPTSKSESTTPGASTSVADDDNSDTVSGSSNDSPSSPTAEGSAQQSLEDQDQRRVSLANRKLAREVSFSGTLPPTSPSASQVPISQTLPQYGLNRKDRRQRAKEEEQRLREEQAELQSREEVRRRSEQRHRLKGTHFEHRPLEIEQRSPSPEHDAALHPAVVSVMTMEELGIAPRTMDEHIIWWRDHEQRKVALTEEQCQNDHHHMIKILRDEVDKLRAQIPTLHHEIMARQEATTRLEVIEDALHQHVAALDGGPEVMQRHPVLSMDEIEGTSEGPGWRKVDSQDGSNDGSQGGGHRDESHRNNQGDNNGSTGDRNSTTTSHPYESRFEPDGTLVVERGADPANFGGQHDRSPSSTTGGSQDAASPTKTGKSKKKALANKRRNEKRKAAKRGQQQDSPEPAVKDGEVAADVEGAAAPEVEQPVSEGHQGEISRTERETADGSKLEPPAAEAQHGEAQPQKPSSAEAADNAQEQREVDTIIQVSEEQADANEQPVAATASPHPVPPSGQQDLLPPVRDDQAPDTSPLALGPAHLPLEQAAKDSKPPVAPAPSASPSQAQEHKQPTAASPAVSTPQDPSASLPVSISALTLEDANESYVTCDDHEQEVTPVFNERATTAAQVPEEAADVTLGGTASPSTDSRSEQEEDSVEADTTAPAAANGEQEQHAQSEPNGEHEPQQQQTTTQPDGQLQLPSWLGQGNMDFLYNYLEANQAVFARAYELSVQQQQAHPDVIWLPGGVGAVPTSADGSARIVGFVEEGHPCWVPLDEGARALASGQHAAQQGPPGRQEGEAYSDDGYRPSSSSGSEASETESEGGSEDGSDDEENGHQRRASIATTSLTTPNRSPVVKRNAFTSAYGDMRSAMLNDMADESYMDQGGYDPMQGMQESPEPEPEPQPQRSSTAYHLPERLRRLKEALAAKGHYGPENVPLQPSGLQEVETESEEEDEETEGSESNEEASENGFDDGGAVDQDDLIDAQNEEIARRVKERERQKQRNASARETRRNWKVAENQTARTWQRASRHARVRIFSNKPAVVTERHRQQQNGRGRKAEVHDEEDEVPLQIDEEAPIKRYAGGEHRNLPRNQIARSLRSRQKGVQVPPPSPNLHRNGFLPSSTSGKDRWTSSRFSIETTVNANPASTSPSRSAAKGKRPQKQKGRKGKGKAGAEDELTDFEDLFPNGGGGGQQSSYQQQSQSGGWGRQQTSYQQQEPEYGYGHGRGYGDPGSTYAAHVAQDEIEESEEESETETESETEEEQPYRTTGSVRFDTGAGGGGESSRPRGRAPGPASGGAGQGFSAFSFAAEGSPAWPGASNSGASGSGSRARGGPGAGPSPAAANLAATMAAMMAQGGQGTGRRDRRRGGGGSGDEEEEERRFEEIAESSSEEEDEEEGVEQQAGIQLASVTELD